MSRALGRYELLRPLARGGMAEVFLARRRAAGVEKVLVIKRIRPERATDAEFLELFVKEARLSMSLTHQNIVPVFDFGRVDDQVYIAMERVEGKDLGSTLARGKPSPLLAAFIASECCEALDYAHRRERDGEQLRVVHRDVTPRNVLLSWSGEVKLTDFGIAALAGDASTKLLGTPAYMAPEQARREPVDARADLYSVGLVLRELLTGERSRSGVDRDALIAAARTGELSPWPDGIPAELVAIVDRATARAAADRYPDARAMLADLDGYMVGDRAATRGEPPARQLAAWLAAAWENDRDDDADASVPDARFESFFDDDAIGTGTERSLAATAADEPVVQKEPKREPPPPPARSSRARWIAPAIVVVAGIGAIAFAVTRGERKPDPVASNEPSLIGSNEPARPIDSAHGSATSIQTVDAIANTVEHTDAAIAPPDAVRVVTVPKRGSAKPPSTPDPPIVLRNVTINAKPWAYFTVDSDPTQHQTMKTIALAPGPHTLKFSNPQLGERTVTITVPSDGDFSHVEDLRPR